MDGPKGDSTDDGSSPEAVLVTGGAGFIGFHVARALLLRGHAVTIYDNFCDAPYPSADKRRNVADLLREFPDLRVVEGCITDRRRVDGVLSGVARVFHLAGLAGVRPSFDSPAEYVRVNTEGTATVFDAACRAGARRFLFASSSSVYGNDTPLPAHEDAAAIAPESPYAASKRGAELVLRSLCKHAPRVCCAALRLFTVYGPRQRPEMAITLFTRRVRDGLPLSMFGDGSMRRDFTHVDDIVRGMLAASEHAPLGFRPYNLGSGSPVRLSELVAAIAAALGTTAQIEQSPVPRGDVDATFACIERARDELGWRPEVPLREGLETVVAWVREQG